MRSGLTWLRCMLLQTSSYSYRVVATGALTIAVVPTLPPHGSVKETTTKKGVRQITVYCSEETRKEQRASKYLLVRTSVRVITCISKCNVQVSYIFVVYSYEENKLSTTRRHRGPKKYQYAIQVAAECRSVDEWAAGADERYTHVWNHCTHRKCDLHMCEYQWPSGVARVAVVSGAQE